MSLPIRNGFASRASMFNTSLSSIQQQIAVVEEQAITGIKLIHPSDIPTSIGEAHDLRAGIDDQQLYQDNGNRSLSLQNQAEQTLGSAVELMKRSWEIAVLASNEVLDDTERQVHALEVADMMEQLEGLAATQFDGRYLFSGMAYDAPPYDANGVYQGSTDEARIQIGDGIWADVGFDGGAIFDPMFQMLGDLEAAIVSNDTDLIADQLPVLQQGLDGVIGERSAMGLEWSKTETQILMSENLETNLSERLNGLIGADPIETYNELAALRSSYESALQVAGTTLHTSLMDYLR